MATEGRRAADAIAGTLEREPWRFEFAQAVRLLEAQARRAKAGSLAIPEDLVRFRATISRSFPSAEITRIAQRRADEDHSVPVMEVAFLGLTGPLGVLPEHYADLLYRRVRSRDYSLRDFFDMFNHRTIALFYRAWEKYRPVVAFERALREDGRQDDSLTRLLTCLIGLGTGSQAGRQAVADSVLIGYAGHFSRRPRSAWTLQTMLRHHFGVPVEVEQFVGRWLDIDPEQRTRLPGADVPRGQFNRLGTDTVLGESAWEEQSRFRLRLGPLDYRTFERLLPWADGRSAFPALAGMTRAYVGPDLDFDVRLSLRRDEVPPLTLGRSADGVVPRLGWNTWLGHRPDLGDRDDALFGGDLLG